MLRLKLPSAPILLVGYAVLALAWAALVLVMRLSPSAIMLLIWPVFLATFVRPGRFYLALLAILWIASVSVFLGRSVDMRSDLLELALASGTVLVFSEATNFSHRVRQRAERRAAVMARLSHRLNSATTPPEAAHIIVEAADELIGWDACMVDLRSPEREGLSMVLLMDVLNGQRSEVPAGNALTGPSPIEARVLNEGPLLILQDGAREAQDPKRFGDTTRSPASLMFVPIRHGKGAASFLSIQSYTPRAYTRSDLDALQGIGDQAAGALDRIWAEEQLRHEALHDPLTHLPNRAYFMDQLVRSLDRARRRQEYLGAVLFLDLDRFKVVNDSLGHLAGDELLIGVARRLESCLRPGDMVSRLGGDEFAILLEDIRVVSDATRVADRILTTVALPFSLDGHEIFTAATIGIALTASGYTRPEDVLRDADTAMYRAKALGKGRYEVFDAAMHAQSVALLLLERDLRRALEREEFMLHYQPIVTSADGKIKMVEALLRWNHPQRGLLAPAQFIPVAEDTGLIVPLGTWVLQEACAELRHWRDTGHPGLCVAVNVSVRQIQDQDLPEVVRGILEETCLPAAALELEITESTAMKDLTRSADTLKRLDAMGVRISIDDFGSSYSALGYLKRFPVSTLKIDQSFVRDIVSSSDSAILTAAMIAMAHTLGLRVVAEGVETERQLEYLNAQQCDHTQGYLFSYPLPSEEISLLLERPPHPRDSGH